MKIEYYRLLTMPYAQCHVAFISDGKQLYY